MASIAPLVRKVSWNFPSNITALQTCMQGVCTSRRSRALAPIDSSFGCMAVVAAVGCCSRS
eukprot:3268984-Amphidinium_carterae.1